MEDPQNLMELMKDMPADIDGDGMVEFNYRVQRAVMNPVPEFPDRALTVAEVKTCLSELGYSDDVTAWLPSEDALEHEGLLSHRADATGDVLRVYIEHDRRTELYTLLPMPDDAFQWHHNDNANDGVIGSMMSSLKDKTGWKELDAVLEDGEYPDVPGMYVSAASFFNAETRPDEYTPYLPDGWVVTQAKRVPELSEMLHPVYDVTVVHRFSSLVVTFEPVVTADSEEQSYAWLVDTLDDPSLPEDEYRDVFGDEVTGEEALQLLLRIDDALES